MTSLQGDSVPQWPHVYTEGDKNPGLIFIFKDLTLITSSLTIKICLQRPTTLLEKTLTILDEQKASLVWVGDPAPSPDLVAGIGQIMTIFALNASNERTTFGRIMIDVKEKVCP